jgi:hypothetical protein
MLCEAALGKRAANKSKSRMERCDSCHEIEVSQVHVLIGPPDASFLQILDRIEKPSLETRVDREPTFPRIGAP